MRPQNWKTGRIESPTYCGGTGALVLGYGEPFELFGYIMTLEGVMTMYGTPEAPRYEKTELCKALDAVLWPEEQ